MIYSRTAMFVCEIQTQWRLGRTNYLAQLPEVKNSKFKCEN